VTVGAELLFWLNERFELNVQSFAVICVLHALALSACA
jgi:hypothetical protein